MPLHLNKIPTLAINYDAIPVLVPEYFTPDAIENFSENIKYFKRATHVFSISKRVATICFELTGKNPADITSMLIDIDRGFERSKPTEVSRVRLANALGSKPYIICVGTLEPRKNHNA